MKALAKQEAVRCYSSEFGRSSETFGLRCHGNRSIYIGPEIGL